MLGGPGREFYGTACTKLAAVSKAQNLAIPGCLNAGDFASLITTLIQRFPILIQFGEALLGGISGEMIVGDPWIASLAPAFIAAHGYGEAIPYAAALAGALFLVAIGYLLSQGKAEVCNDPT